MSEDFIPLSDNTKDDCQVDANYWANWLLDLQDPAVEPEKWPKLLEAMLSQLHGDRVGIRQNIYASSFFRTQKFTPKVRDSRQIQCYQMGVICDKFNAKKNKKILYAKKCI